MSRPQTKNDLITGANTEFEKLIKILESISPAELTADFPSAFKACGVEAHWQRDRNCKDILIHLYEWQQLWLEWVEANMGGEKRPFLPSPYTWNNYAQMNEEFRIKHQNTSYNEALELLSKTHAKILAKVQNFNNEELFTKKYFSFTGTTSLGSYAVSATYSHYVWANKKIRKYKKFL